MNICNVELPEEGLVLISGRPGVGKSYVLLEMANELSCRGIKPVLVYTDGLKAHSVFNYADGKIQQTPSKLSCIKKIYPDISYVVEDYAKHMTSVGWERLLKDIVEYEKPKVILINALYNSSTSADTDVLRSVQSIAKENHILILGEIPASRSVEKRKDRHPTQKDVTCNGKPIKYADSILFVYRDSYCQDCTDNKYDMIEVYSSRERTVKLSFDAQKYISQ